MKYNENNLVVTSTITQLEDKLNDLIKEMNYFKEKTLPLFNELEIDISPNPSLSEAINKLKQLNNVSDKYYGSILNGEEYDLKNDKINKNEIKFVALVKPNQEIEFNVSLKSYIKPTNQFTTGNKNFITVDWGDGTATQGYQHFRHVYDTVDDSFIPYNEEYKQVVITIKPTCYLEDEDVLLPNNVSFNNACKYLILGIYNNYQGIDTDYYIHSLVNIDYRDYKNLRYFYGTTFNIGAHAFYECHRLKKIVANIIYFGSDTRNAFQNCYSLQSIDADLMVNDTYNSTNRTWMFTNCYSLSKIKSLNFGTVEQETDYDQIFSNCFNLVEIPGLIIDCQISKATTCSFFCNCMSLENPFKYLKNINMLRCANKLFYGCNQIVEAPTVLDLSLATSATEVFAYCTRLEIAPKILYLDNVGDMSNFFSNCYHLLKTPTIIAAPKANNINYLFQKSFLLKTIDCDLDFPNVSNSYVQPFNYCYSLEAFECNIVRFGSNDITSGHLDQSRYVFQHCKKLKKFPKKELSIRYLDFTRSNEFVHIEEFPEIINIVSNLNIENRLRTFANIKKLPKIINIPDSTGVCSLFQDCIGLKEINGLTINIGKRTSISSIFEGCINLESITDLTINAPNATDISYMFRNCKNLKILNNVRINLKPDSNINMNYIFSGCLNLKEIPDLGFDYADCVSNMAYAFEYSGLRKVNMTKPFARLIDAKYAFQYCRFLEEFTFKCNKLGVPLNYLVSMPMSLRKIDLDLSFNPGNQQFLHNATPAQLSDMKINFNSCVWENNGQFSINNYGVINRIELLNYANNSNIMIENNPRLRNLKITFKSETTANIYLRNSGIDANGLNEFFRGLPSASGRTIYIKGTTGMDTCDKTIATAKGWTVNTTS